MYRRFALGAIFVAAVWLVATHTADLASFMTTAAGGSWQWLLAAVALQAAYYACYVTTYRLGFSSAGISRTSRELAPVMFASIFVGTVVPSAGTVGPGLIVDESVHRGNALAPSAAAVLIAQVADFAGFAVVMAAGFAYLAAAGQLTIAEAASALAFVALLGLLAAVVVLARRSPERLASALGALERLAARLMRALRREPSLGWAQPLAHGLSDSLALVSARRKVAVAAWLTAVLGHAFDLASFVAIGFAFGWHGVGALVAGYAVGVVVWLVSLVPQGVGVVEGAIGVLLASLGVPTPTAAAISLTFRGLTFWLPFTIGFFAAPRVGTFADAGRGSRGRFTARAASVLVFIVGLMNILSAVTPSLAARLVLLEAYLPLQVSYGHLATALAGIALLLLSRALWRHKRNAFLLTVVLLGVSTVTHIVKGLDYEEAVITASAMIWLLTQRATFYARSDVPSLRQGVRVLAAGLATTLAYGTAGFWLLDRQFSVNFDLAAAVRQTFVMFVQFRDPGLEPLTGFGRYFAASIYVVGAATFGFGLLMLLRPVLVRHPASQAERRRAHAIVTRWGASAFAPIALLSDKAYWFSEGGSVVAYGVTGGTAVSLADPIGPPEDLASAVDGFTAFAEGNGWRAVFYEVDERNVDVYRSLGQVATHIGDEAVVELATFSTAGKSYKNLRNRINRLEEDGYRTRLVPAPLSNADLAALRDVSDAWLDHMKGSEKRFSLGWFDDDYLRACPTMVVRDPAGEIVAFANVLAEFKLNEVTIDLMRHRPEAPSGTMDYLFVRLFAWAREAGYDSFNLGLSPLAGVGDEEHDPAVEKVLRLVYEYGNAFYGFKGLHAYKEKFDPVWRERYLISPDTAALPAAVAAAAALTSDVRPAAEYVVRLLRRA